VFVATRMADPIEGLAVAAVVGVAIHFVWQLPALYRHGYRLKLVKPFAHPEVRTIFLLMVPTVIGLCADQVNAFVGQLCASFLREGSITALYNSNRVMQLPLALFGVAVASVALPALSHNASDEKMPVFKEMLSFSLRIANYVLIPSFVGLAVLGYPVVKLLFEHGRFKPEYTGMTYAALVGFSVGLPAFSATRILASAFYARKNTKTPVRIAFQAMAVNVVLNVTLMWKWNVAGLAFATAVAGWYQAIILFILLRKELGNLDGRAILKSFVFSSVAGVAMGALCYVLSFVLLTKLPNALNVLVSVGAGGLFYLAVSRLLKVEEYRILIDIVRRRKLPAA